MSDVGPPAPPSSQPTRTTDRPAICEWQEMLDAAQHVMTSRLSLLCLGDGRGVPELQRALTEKISFCARWTWIFSCGGWLAFDGAFAAMLSEMTTIVSENHERLTRPGTAEAGRKAVAR